VNKAILFGNVGKDPEVRSLNDGTKAATFSMATNEVWKDKQSGERKERTEWHRIVAFGPIAETIAQYVRKGTKLLVEGKVQTRKWVDQSGTERFTTEILIGPRGSFQLLGASGRPAGGMGGIAADAAEHDQQNPGPIEPEDMPGHMGTTVVSDNGRSAPIDADDIPF